jgi:hypothetical protein
MTLAYTGPTTTELEPNDDDMHRFLSWWFGACNRGYIEFGWTDTRTGTPSLFRRFDLADIAEAVRFAAETNSRPGANLYVRAATIRPDTQYTHDSDVIQIPGFSADCDTAEATERAWTYDRLPAGAYVITGRIPVTRAQFWWKLAEPLSSADGSRQLNRQVLALSGGDPAVVNPARLMRLPGSISWPYKLGRTVEATKLTNDTLGCPYGLEAVRSALPVVAPSESPGDQPTTTTDLLNPIGALIERIRTAELTGAEWRLAVLSLTAKLITRGTPIAAILGLADHLTRPGYAVADTRAKMAVMIQGARRRGFAPEGDGEPEPANVDDVMDVSPKPVPAKFPFLSNADIATLPDPVWLIENVLQQNSLAALYGQWGVFKSFIVLDWALCLATGRRWLDRTVTRTDVLYIAGEGVGGLKDRIAAWQRSNGVDGLIPGFRVVPMTVNMMDLTEAERLVHSAVEEQAASSFMPGMIICDTLARAMVGGDENAVKDMSVVIHHSDIIRRKLGGATFLIVHHAGKDAERGMRGSTGLPGALDTSFRVTRKDNSMVVELFCEKQKDGEDKWALHMRAEKVVLPLRPGNLKQRDSLVLVPEQAPASNPETVIRPKGNAAVGLAVLADTIVSEGTRLPGTDGFPTTPTRGVTELAWRREFYRRLTDKTPAAKRQAYGRMVNDLRNARLIAICDGWVWLVRSGTSP